MATAPNEIEADDDAFSKAFENLSAEPVVPVTDTSTSPAAAAPAEAPAAAAAPEAPAEPAAAAEAPAEGDEEQTDDEKAAAAAAAAKPVTPAPSEDDEDDKLLKRLARVIKKEPTEPAAPAPTAPVEQQLPDVLSAEERTFIAEYEKDWPDVAKAEAIRRKAEYAHLTGYIFKEVMSQFAPMQEMMRDMASHLQLQQLQTAVPDYEDVRQPVIDWVAKQPRYLQNAYQDVIASGTVEEVNDLIARFRADTGAPAAAAAAPAAAVKKEPELPTATKQAAASLAPVSSKRSAVPQGDDPNDFASAFAKFDGLLK